MVQYDLSWSSALISLIDSSLPSEMSINFNWFWKFLCCCSSIFFISSPTLTFWSSVSFSNSPCAVLSFGWFGSGVRFVSVFFPFISKDSCSFLLFDFLVLLVVPLLTYDWKGVEFRKPPLMVRLLFFGGLWSFPLFLCGVVMGLI